MKNILVTGGAGFIGSNFVRCMLDRYPSCRIVVYDKLTYAGNLENLRDVANDPRYTFTQGDICDAVAVREAIETHQIDTIVNFAAETHVDRSILEPASFIQTDVFGTYVLLEATRKYGLERYLQVSSDEVYGSIESGSFREGDALCPNSPYSASKAGAELLVRAYHSTWNLPVLITRGANTHGPYQYPEKVAPLFITNALEDKPLPLYGDGLQVRDWLYVADHCTAIDLVLHRGVPGEAYNVGAGNERTNLEITHFILDLLGKTEGLIQHVTDRPGHDRRYSLDCAKIAALGWKPAHPFEEAFAETARWYRENRWWWEKIKSGQAFQEYYQRQYAGRERKA